MDINKATQRLKEIYATYPDQTFPEKVKAEWHELVTILTEANIVTPAFGGHGFSWNYNTPAEPMVGTVVVYYRSHLIRHSKDKLLADIKLTDLRGGRDPMILNHVVMFIEDDGRTKLLKNRWGNDGVVGLQLSE